MLLLEKIFRISENGTSIKTEIIAGSITFLTMAYISIVNPLILEATGMNSTVVFVTTCLACAFGAFLMAFYANLPLALGPSLGLNAIFTYTIVISLGYTWQNALAITFIAGLLVVLIVLFLSKDFLIKAIPSSIKFAVTAGIGMFIMLIALKNAGIVIGNPNTLIKLAKFNNFQLIAVVISFFIIAASFIKRLYFMPMLVIIVLSLLNAYINDVQFDKIISVNVNISETFFVMDFSNIFHIGITSLIVAMIFGCIFDTLGTLISYSYFLNPKNPELDGKKVKKGLLVGGLSTMFAGAIGTSPYVIFLESNAGVGYGGRTGLTSFVIGVLFLLAIFFSPIIKYIPIWVASPILMFLGVSMMSSLKNVNFDDLTDTIPSIVCLVTIPFSYSIATGIAAAFISYVIIKVLAGRFKEISLLTWGLSVIFLISFII